MRQRSPERRAEILKAATELFSAQGFDSTTTREIAERVGVSEPILFRHFATKRQLLLAVLEERGPGSRWAALATATDAAVFETALRGLLRRYLDMTWEHLPLFRVLWQEARRDTEIRTLMRGQYAAVQSSLSRVLESAVANGEVRADLAAAGAEVIGLALRGYLGRLAMRPPADWPAERDACIEQLVAVVTQGLLPRP